ncbi:MAG: alpha/beta hydrolase [Dehalococcoidia bacterium]|nr:alpha/beta hydrolase [Dehalococcoidia bacterium]
MEPRIQYAQTGDGVSIAYWAMGEGPPLIVMPNIPLSHVELEVRIPEYRGWYESMIGFSRLVRYDNRGSGLSDREVSDFSLEAHVRDLSAVAGQLGDQPPVLVAPLLIGPVAIAYAARWPERVSRLIFWCSFARGADYYQSSALQALAAMRDKDWEMYTEARAHVALGWEAGDPVRRYAAYMRECVSEEVAGAVFDATEAFDVSDLLPQIKSPTLILHRRQAAYPPWSSPGASLLASPAPVSPPLKETHWRLLSGTRKPSSGRWRSSCWRARSRSRRLNLRPPAAYTPFCSPISRAPPPSPSASATPAPAS